MTAVMTIVPVDHLDQIHLLLVAPVLRPLLKWQHLPHVPAVNHGCASQALLRHPRPRHHSNRQRTPHHRPVVAVNLKGRPKPVDQLQDFTYARMSVPPLLLYCVALLVRWLLLLKRFQNQQPNQPHTPLR